MELSVGWLRVALPSKSLGPSLCLEVSPVPSFTPRALYGTIDPSCNLDPIGYPAVHTGPAELHPPALPAISPSEVTRIKCLKLSTLVSPWSPTLCPANSTMPLLPPMAGTSSHLESYCPDRCKALQLPPLPPQHVSPSFCQPPAGPRTFA